MNLPQNIEESRQLRYNHDFSFHGVTYQVEEDRVRDRVEQKGLVNWVGETGSYSLRSLSAHVDLGRNKIVCELKNKYKNVTGISYTKTMTKPQHTPNFVHLAYSRSSLPRNKNCSTLYVEVRKHKVTI